MNRYEKPGDGKGLYCLFLEANPRLNDALQNMEHGISAVKIPSFLGLVMRSFVEITSQLFVKEPSEILSFRCSSGYIAGNPFIEQLTILNAYSV